MNPGQQKFYQFIMDRVQKGKEGEAKALLAESFGRQDKGTFTPEYLKSFGPRLVPLLKPEALDEVKGIMARFGQDHTARP